MSDNPLEDAAEVIDSLLQSGDAEMQAHVYRNELAARFKLSIGEASSVMNSISTRFRTEAAKLGITTDEMIERTPDEAYHQLIGYAAGLAIEHRKHCDGEH